MLSGLRASSMAIYRLYCVLEHARRSEN